MTALDIRQFELVDPAPAGQLILSVRAPDADRERAIGVLSEAFAEGRLTTEEHSARVEHVYGARTYAELAVLIARPARCRIALPPVRSAPRSAAPPAAAPGAGFGWRAIGRGVVIGVPARDRDESDGPVTAPAAGSAAGRSLPGLPVGRRPEFDVMRAFVVAGLVVFHSAGGVRRGHVLVLVNGPAAQRRVHRLPAVGVAVGNAAAVPGLGDGGTVCDAHPPGGGVRPGAAGPAGNPVRGRPGSAGPADVLPRKARPARRSPVVLAVLAQLREPSRDRRRAAAARVVDIGRRQLRPRAPVVPVRPAGLLRRAAAAAGLPAGPAGQAADRPAGRFRRAPRRRRGVGSRDPHDGDRGGVRPGCQHRRLGTRDICVPVPVRVRDRLRPAVRGCAAALPPAGPGGWLRGDRRAAGLGGCPGRIGRRSQRRARRAGARCRAWPGWAWIAAIMGFAGSAAARRAELGRRTRSGPAPGRRPGRDGAGPPGPRTRRCCPSTCCTSRSSWRPPGSSSAGPRRSPPSMRRWSSCPSPRPSACTRRWSGGSASPGSCPA